MADLLLFENADTTVAIELDSTRITRYEVKRLHRGIRASAKYILNKKSLSLSYAFATRGTLFYNENSCDTKQDDSFSMSGLGDLLSATQAQTTQFDQNCKNQIELQKQIDTNLNSFFDSKNINETSKCIANYDLTSAQKWRALPKSLTTISCESSNVKYSGLFDSQKKQIKISSKCLQDPKDLTSVLKEEMLHSFGVTDESLAKCLAKCPQTSFSASCKAFDQTLKRISQNTRSEYTNLVITSPDGTIAQNVTSDYNSAKTIEVPREIAVAQVPQPTIADLKMNHSVETMTVTDTPTVASAGGTSSGGNASEASASSDGRSYSVASYPNSMMQFAATAVLPEKAFAQETSSTNAGGTPTRSSRSSVSTTSEALRHTAASRLPASNTVLTDPKYSKTTNPAGTSGENTDTATTATGASREVGKSNTVKAMHSSGGDGNGSGGSRSPASVGGDYGDSRDGGAGSGTRLGSGSGPGSSKGSNPGSSGAGSSSSGVGSVAGSRAAGSPGNLVQYFQTAPYGEIKQRLRDPKFIRDLQKNSTTVFDAQGNRFGAAQGQVIFSDKGNRFVKEK